MNRAGNVMRAEYYKDGVLIAEADISMNDTLVNVANGFREYLMATGNGMDTFLCDIFIDKVLPPLQPLQQRGRVVIPSIALSRPERYPGRVAVSVPGDFYVERFKQVTFAEILRMNRINEVDKIRVVAMPMECGLSKFIR